MTDQHAADEVARLTANAHPDRREARLFVGVLRDGPSLSLLQMRPDEDADPYGDLELLTYDGLAPHLVHACTRRSTRSKKTDRVVGARQLSAAGCVAARVEALE